jgi:ABC-type Fe3+ transport system substrate-binding protein
MENKGYNGHKNRAHWNVSLWISNDEGLYLTAKSFVKRSKTLPEAAQKMLDYLFSNGIEKTPDGYKYNFSNIRASLTKDM